MLCTSVPADRQLCRDVAASLSPCGMCRQVIREFCAKKMPILLVPADYEERVAKGKEDGVLETNIDELLPHSFGPEDLDRPRQPHGKQKNETDSNVTNTTSV